MLISSSQQTYKVGSILALCYRGGRLRSRKIGSLAQGDTAVDRLGFIPSNLVVQSVLLMPILGKLFSELFTSLESDKPPWVDGTQSMGCRG